MEFGPYSRNKQTNEQTSMNQSTARSTLGWRSTTLLNGTYGLRQTAILPMTSGHNGQAGQDDVKPSGICRLLFLVICQCSLQVSYVHAAAYSSYSPLNVCRIFLCMLMKGSSITVVLIILLIRTVWLTSGQSN